MQEIDRTRRVSELIKRELATLIARELNDNRINSVAITDVTVSKDLKQSTVYVSSVDDLTTPVEREKLLNNAAKYLRRLLSQKTSLRITPNLVFKYDETIRRGVEMTHLIDSLNKKSSQKE